MSSTLSVLKIKPGCQLNEALYLGVVNFFKIENSIR